MGARNSTSQTVRIENPQRVLAMQVTPSVVSRLVGGEEECIKCKEDEQIKQQTLSKNSLENPHHLPHNWTQDIFEAKFNELEEYQFEKYLQKVKTMIGEPLAWLENVNGPIQPLKNALIKCYQDNPKQSLRCADIAKEYQNFIFREQYTSILKSNDK